MPDAIVDAVMPTPYVMSLPYARCQQAAYASVCRCDPTAADAENTRESFYHAALLMLSSFDAAEDIFTPLRYAEAFFRHISLKRRHYAAFH